MARAVAGCSGVAGLSAGPFGGAGTYLPGGRIDGIQVRDREVEIHIVARYGRPLPEVAAQVADAAAPYAAGRAVHVVIDDIVADDGEGSR